MGEESRASLPGDDLMSLAGGFDEVMKAEKEMAAHRAKMDAEEKAAAAKQARASRKKQAKPKKKAVVALDGGNVQLDAGDEMDGLAQIATITDIMSNPEGYLNDIEADADDDLQAEMDR